MKHSNKKNVTNIPVPQGKYVPAIRNENVIYTSGMTPRLLGELLYSGKMRVESNIETYRDAVELATLNAFEAAQSCLKYGEVISKILQMSIFLNTEDDFTQHSKIADFASEILTDFLGINNVGTRVTIGVASLPSNAPVEITLVCSAN